MLVLLAAFLAVAACQSSQVGVAERRHNEEVQSALGANANGVPVELALAALLRGEAEDVLEKSMYGSISKLRERVKELQEAFAKDTPLPPPSALKTMHAPLIREALMTLMEILSPEFPMFLSGAPFTFEAARASAAMDRSTHALEDARLAITDFTFRAEWMLSNATEIARLRRTQIEKRHLMEMEQLFTVDSAAAAIEVLRLAEIEAKRRMAWQEKMEQNEKTEKDLRNQTEVMLYKMRRDAKTESDDNDVFVAAHEENERRAKYNNETADAKKQEAEDRKNAEFEYNAKAPIRAFMRNGTSFALAEMQKLELEFYDKTVAAVSDIMKCRIALDMNLLSNCMNSVSYVMNTVRPSRNDSVECLVQANAWLAESYDLNEDQAAFFTVTAGLTGAVAVAVEQTMRALMSDILACATPFNNVTGLTEESAFLVQAVRDMFIRAHSELMLLRNSSRLYVGTERILANTTTMTFTTTTAEPLIKLDDRSPAWLRRQAFIQRVRDLKSWRLTTTSFTNPPTNTDKLVEPTTEAPHTVNGTTGWMLTSMYGTTTSMKWTPQPTGPPLNLTAAAAQINALATRLKAFSMGIAEYDAARVGLTRGTKESKVEGTEALANALDDLNLWDTTDALSNVTDNSKVDPKLLAARKQLAERVAAVQGHLQVTSFLRNENTDGYNFFGRLEMVQRDTLSKPDAVDNGMDNILGNFKVADDLFDTADAAGILMGGEIGTKLRKLKSHVERFRREFPLYYPIGAVRTAVDQVLAPLNKARAARSAFDATKHTAKLWNERKVEDQVTQNDEY